MCLLHFQPFLAVFSHSRIELAEPQFFNFLLCLKYLLRQFCFIFPVDVDSFSISIINTCSEVEVVPPSDPCIAGDGGIIFVCLGIILSSLYYGETILSKGNA